MSSLILMWQCRWKLLYLSFSVIAELLVWIRLCFSLKTNIYCILCNTVQYIREIYHSPPKHHPWYLCDNAAESCCIYHFQSLLNCLSESDYVSHLRQIFIVYFVILYSTYVKYIILHLNIILDTYVTMPLEVVIFTIFCRCWIACLNPIMFFI